MRNLILRLLAMLDGPQCPDCPHLAHGHTGDGCLCSVPIERTLDEPQSTACQCKTPFGGSKRSEHRTRRQMAGV